MCQKYASWVTLRPQWDHCRQGEVKVHILNFITTWSEFQKVSQTATEQGKAEQCIFDFKTTWSELQKASQTAADQGKAKLCFLDFLNHLVKVSEAHSDPYWARQSRATYLYTRFRNYIVRVPKACQTAVMWGEAELRTYNLIKTSPPQIRFQAAVCVSTPRMYPRSAYFLVW